MSNSLLSSHFFPFKCRVEIGGRTAVVSLIARRSRHFAGTRFLRRGVNDEVPFAFFLFLFFFIIIIGLTIFSFLFSRDALQMMWKQSKLWRTPLELICTILGISLLLCRFASVYYTRSFRSFPCFAFLFFLTHLFLFFR